MGGCGQVQLGKPKVIFYCYVKTELGYDADFLHMRRLP